MIFQVKSGGVNRKDIAALRGDMEREKAPMATLITLEEPTKAMKSEAKVAGLYTHELTGNTYDRIQIVTVRAIIEDGKRFGVAAQLGSSEEGRFPGEGGAATATLSASHRE
jgi:hypothetical protein